MEEQELNETQVVKKQRKNVKDRIDSFTISSLERLTKDEHAIVLMVEAAI